jgi:hypothetical protein
MSAVGAPARSLLTAVLAVALAAGPLSACARGKHSPAAQQTQNDPGVPADTPSSGALDGFPGGTADPNQAVPALPDQAGTVLPDDPAAQADPAADPAAPRTDLAGVQYAFLTKVDPATRAVTFDKIDWFTGAAAHKACVADRVAIRDGAWCNDYYYRNNNPLLRTSTATAAAKTSVIDADNGTAQTPASLAQIRTVAAANHRPFVLTISGGLIVALREQFIP